MTWTEFRSLLSGLGHDTPLARTVQIRLENDKDVLKNFTSSQHNIRNKWRSKKAKEVSAKDTSVFIEQMKQAFISIAED